MPEYTYLIYQIDLDKLVYAVTNDSAHDLQKAFRVLLPSEVKVKQLDGSNNIGSVARKFMRPTIDEVREHGNFYKEQAAELASKSDYASQKKKAEYYEQFHNSKTTIKFLESISGEMPTELDSDTEVGTEVGTEVDTEVDTESVNLAIIDSDADNQMQNMQIKADNTVKEIVSAEKSAETPLDAKHLMKFADHIWSNSVNVNIIWRRVSQNMHHLYLNGLHVGTVVFEQFQSIEWISWLTCDAVADDPVHASEQDAKNFLVNRLLGLISHTN